MVKNFHAIHNILNAVWAIEPTYAETAGPLLYGMLVNGQHWQGELSTEQPWVISGRQMGGEISGAEPGSIAIISINGPLQRQDQSCGGPVGTETMGKWIKQAAANPNIDGIILKLNTPGGTVDATEELANIIKSVAKPVVGLADMAASAGYWIGSSAKELYANGETAMVGSIGTMMSFADMQPLWEKAGVKFHEIYATESTEKNRVFREARQGTPEGYQALRESILDPLNAVFLNTVQANRGQKLSAKESTLTGKTYYGSNAKKVGLVDGVGNMDTAISAVRRLAKLQKTQQKMTTENVNITGVLVAAGAKEFTVVAAGDILADGGFLLTEEQLASLAQNVDLMQSEAERVQGELVAANEANDLLRAEVQALEANSAEADLRAEIATLEQRLAAAEERADKYGKGASTAGTKLATGTETNANSGRPTWWTPDGTETMAQRHQ